MSIRVEWHENIAKVPPEVAMEALWLVGQNLITEATNNIPLDTGTLRRSGTVTVGALPPFAEVYEGAQKEDQAKRYEGQKQSGARLVYVSYNTPYARRLHENLNWRPRDWKYSRRKRRSVKGGYTRKSRAAGFEGTYVRKIPKPAVGGPKWIERAAPRAFSRMDEMVRRAKAKMGVV